MLSVPDGHIFEFLFAIQQESLLLQSYYPLILQTDCIVCDRATAEVEGIDGRMLLFKVIITPESMPVHAVIRKFL